MWVCDKTKKERYSHKGSVDEHIKKIETEKGIMVMIDTPGDKKYMKNMIRGIAMADAVVLVISATDKIEKGTELYNQILEQGILAC